MHLEGIEISRILSDQVNIVEKKNRSEKRNGFVKCFDFRSSNDTRGKPKTSKSFVVVFGSEERRARRSVEYVA